MYLNTSDSDTTDRWYHWKKLFDRFLAALEIFSPAGTHSHASLSGGCGTTR